MKLLTIQSDPKTVKGEKYGYMTAVMYLSPSALSGRNLCPFAVQAGCEATCLNTAGRGVFASTQQARLNRTRLFNEQPIRFMSQLGDEIHSFARKAEKAGLVPVVRLNGTSDIMWEELPLNVFGTFPEIQFYDYTKIAKRFSRELPANYHLSLSYSEASARYKAVCWRTFFERQASLIMVIRDDARKQIAMQDLADVGYNVIDGDEHDLRFLDPKGSLVLLRAKGKARYETNGFVLNGNHIASIVDAANQGEVA